MDQDVFGSLLEGMLTKMRHMIRYWEASQKMQRSKKNELGIFQLRIQTWKVHQKTAAQQKAGMMLVCLGSCLEIMIMMNDNLKYSVVSLYHLASLHRDVFCVRVWSLNKCDERIRNEKRHESVTMLPSSNICCNNPLAMENPSPHRSHETWPWPYFLG